MPSPCTRSCYKSELGERDPMQEALAEIARLQESKRHFSALADAKGKENVELRQENERLQGIIENMREIRTTRDFEQT